jgi:DNA-binding transcriptional MerR regulator
MDPDLPSGPSGNPCFSIGEFSRITGLSLKALRLYHEKGLLVPSRINRATNYRFYAPADGERARVITRLRDMDFSLEDIGEILENCRDEADALDYLENQKAAISAKLARYRDIAGSLDQIIQKEKESQMNIQETGFEVEEKEVSNLLFAGYRFQGKYSDCGQGFSRVAKAMGRYLCGKAMCLYYDPEYKEDGADIEAGFPVRKGRDAEGISVRELKGGACVSLIHKGPYEEIGRSYEKITAYVKAKGFRVILPSREIYLKGPGMILRGNPKNYLTEIQMMIER